MTTVRQSELDTEPIQLCTDCLQYEGAIWLCGEGAVCEQCFARAADIPEHEAFGETDPETRMKAKTSLAYKRASD